MSVHLYVSTCVSMCACVRKIRMVGNKFLEACFIFTPVSVNIVGDSTNV